MTDKPKSTESDAELQVEELDEVSGGAWNIAKMNVSNSLNTNFKAKAGGLISVQPDCAERPKDMLGVDTLKK